jgi:hypothetical protein
MSSHLIQFHDPSQLSDLAGFSQIMEFHMSPPLSFFFCSLKLMVLDGISQLIYLVVNVSLV